VELLSKLYEIIRKMVRNRNLKEGYETIKIEGNYHKGQETGKMVGEKIGKRAGN